MENMMYKRVVCKRFQKLNLCQEFIENGVSCLDLLEIPRERKNKDLGKNRHGALLLVFCKGNNMIILNGRLNGGKVSFPGSDNSIIRLLILS
jgi:hypothetical protein